VELSNDKVRKSVVRAEATKWSICFPVSPGDDECRAQEIMRTAHSSGGGRGRRGSRKRKCE
jgi:hypothetical protein